MKSKRLMIFIDGSNVYKESKRYCGSDYRVDYLKLVEHLRGEYDLIRTYFYGSRTIEDVGFYEFLQYQGIKTTIKPLRQKDGRPTEKGVDVALATDILALGFRNAYDIALVVSGDGDLVNVIEMVQGLGKIVNVVFYKNSMAKELKLKCDEIIYLDELKEAIKLGEKGEIVEKKERGE